MSLEDARSVVDAIAEAEDILWAKALRALGSVSQRWGYSSIKPHCQFMEYVLQY